MDIADHLHVQGSPEELCEIWESPVSEEFPLRDLGKGSQRSAVRVTKQ